MKNTIITVILIVVTIFVTHKCTEEKLQEDVSKVELEFRKLKIKRDSLTKINDSLTTKLVADTLEIKELRKINDSLALQVKNPKVITIVEFKPEDKQVEIDTLGTDKDTLVVSSSYPNKEKPFVKYEAKIDKQTNTGKGQFKFYPQEVVIGIGENKDGTYTVNTKLPEYFKAVRVDVQSLPKKEIKEDNFGWLLGARIGEDLRTSKGYLKLNAGIRVKKIYFSVGVASNANVEGGLDYEF